MKNFLFVLLIIPAICFGAVEPVELPEWVAAAVNFMTNVPYVGPVLVVVLKWASIISAIATALSLFVQAIFAALIGVGNFVGLEDEAEKFKSLSDKILPWLKYFSMFNVQKRK
jgi:hypothetical protein